VVTGRKGKRLACLVIADVVARGVGIEHEEMYA
jgi:hypothetical protein